MAKRVNQIVKESGTYFDSNLHLRDSLIKQQVEAWIGGLFLTIGFICQIMAYADRSGSIYEFYMIFIFMVPILFLFWNLFSAVATLISNQKIAKFNRTQIYNSIDNHGKETISGPQLSSWGQLLGIQRIPSETDSDYFDRIFKHINNNSRYPLTDK